MSWYGKKDVWRRKIPVEEINPWNKPKFGEGEGGPKCKPVPFGTGWDDYKFAGWICYCTKEHMFIDGSRNRHKM